MAKVEVKLPDIGEGVTEGEFIKWLVKQGETIKVDQPLAEVMTDKATVEIPSTTAGQVLELKAKPGEVIPIGQTLLVLESSTGGVSAAASAPGQSAAPAKAPAEKGFSPAPMSAGATGFKASVAAQAGSGSVDVYPPVADSKVLATPSTRRFAREMNIDINRIQGSGLAGRVTRDDVVQNSGGSPGGAGAVAAGPAQYPTIPKMAYSSSNGTLEERVALKGVRKKIAEKMQLSKHVIPHFTLMDEANVTALVRLRGEMKDIAQKKGVKITYLPFVMKALITTIREFPMFNASIDDAASEIVYKKYFNLGFAADTPQGLLVPVLKDADQKTLLELSAEITQLSEKARAGKLAPEEMKGATISITNIGSVGGTYATPIINHPEVAILGMYKIQEKPVFVGDSVQKANVMNVTITADHRLIDGAVAANFLKAFVQRLENPGALMMDMS